MTALLAPARRLVEAGIPAVDPVAYREELQAILASIGTTIGTAESEAVALLEKNRRQVQATLAQLAADSPSRAMYERALAGIEQSMANLAADLNTSVAKWQTQGLVDGANLAVKPVAGQRGVELISAALGQDQLKVLTSYSADLVQGLTGDLRKRINGELASVMVGAKSPTAAAKAIGANLTDPNHFSTIAHRARAIVVTEVGRAQALGTQAGQQALQTALADAGDHRLVLKRWLNAHLPGARQTHLEAEAKYAPDGAVGPIPTTDLFSVGGFMALYPKDPSLPPSESVHCHCVSITVIDDASANALAQPPAVAQAQAAYTAALTKAEVPATVATEKHILGEKAATFLADPYGKAGLQPLKTLKDGTLGYGGEPLAKALGYTKANNPLVWDKDLGAWRHPAAAAGKQLPDFAKLTPLEQQALMERAALTPETQGQIFKHLDVDVPAQPVYTTSPPALLEPTPPPAPPPPPPPAPPPPVVTAPPIAPAAPAVRAARTTTPRISVRKKLKPVAVGRAPGGSGYFADALSAMGRRLRNKLTQGKFLERAEAIAGSNSYDVASGLKDAHMRKFGNRIDNAVPAGSDQASWLIKVQAAADDMAKGFGTYGATTPGETLATKLINLWADTSGDSNSSAIAMQRSVAETFGLKWPGAIRYEFIDDATMQGADRLYRKHKEVLNTFTRIQYEETQAELSRLFPDQDYVTLVRGFGRHGGSMGITDVAIDEVLLNPASSFTISTDISAGFGNTTMFVQVPKERILGSTVSGWGCYREKEFVVIGSNTAEKVTLIPSSYTR